MSKNLEQLQKELEKKAKRRVKKKKMKVSGKGVFELKKIIEKRARVSKKRK